MSRTNPHKKKRRSANKTLLMYGEGFGEEVFLKYLRGVYSYNRGTAVTIRNGKGGGAIEVIVSASREPGDFGRRVVVLDDDKGVREMNKARSEAKSREIELLENTPCLEALLLATLRKGGTFSNKSPDWCKNEFESNYLDKHKRMEIEEYQKVFPKDMLEKRMKDVPVLSQLILIMEGK